MESFIEIAARRLIAERATFDSSQLEQIVAGVPLEDTTPRNKGVQVVYPTAEQQEQFRRATEG